MVFNGTIRQLRMDETIPYPLLLLADETVDAINTYIHDSDIFVFEEGTTIIGVYALQIIEKNVAEIKNIAVDKKFQGQGIGFLLMSDAIIRAQEKGCTEVIVGTAPSAGIQLALYHKAGFTEYAIRPDFYIRNYPEPIIEDGIQLRDMVLLKKQL